MARTTKKRLMIMFRKACLILSVLPTIAATETTSKVTLVDNPFNEIVRKRTEISGARLVGFLSAPQGHPEGDTIEVAADIPADWQGKALCLKVVSADGRYESRNAYTVASDWAGGRATLSYPSTYAAEALAYTGKQIAGLISAGDCSQTQAQVAPIYWGNAAARTFALLLNSARSDKTFLTFPYLPDQEDVICAATTSPLRTAFDMRCDLPSDIAALDKVEAIVISFKNGEMGPEERLTLRFGVSE